MLGQFEAPSRMAPTIAQQIFVLGSGIAGGLAGFALAKGFSGVKDVSTPLVVGTTIISVICTLAAGLYLSDKSKEGPA